MTNTETLLVATKEFGLEVNTEKAKWTECRTNLQLNGSE
jgi:hypothetical protein